MNRIRLWAGLLALLAVALVATGCGSASTSTGSATLKASDINPQPRDKVKLVKRIAELIIKED